MKLISRHARECLGIVLLLPLVFKCSLFLDCEGAEGMSPKELFEKSDYVLLGKIVAADTLLRLDDINYLGSSASFFVMEYTFQPERTYKNKMPIRQIHLWSCDHTNNMSGYSEVLDLDTLTSYLVYGNQIEHKDQIINVMRRVPTFEKLKKLLESVRPSLEGLRWPTMLADSAIASRIVADGSLLARLENRISKDEVISYSIDGFNTFLKHNLYNGVCYYENGKRHDVSPETYLKRLNSIAMSSQNTKN